MNAFLIYQIKVAFCLSLFIILYFLLFRKETFHIANRIYLLGSLLFSLCIPLINAAVIFPSYEQPVLGTLRPVFIQAIVTTPTSEFHSIEWPMAIYAMIAGLFAAFFFNQIFRLLSLVLKFKPLEINKFKVYCIPEQKQPFSFFRFIFVSSVHPDSQILQHEMTHARQFHTVDILLVQIIKIFQWFNPFIYLFEKAIQETHEYLADEAAMEHGGQSDRYRMLLVTQAFGVQPGIFNFFNYSLVKNRMIMITKTKSLRRYYLKYLASLPVMLVALMLLSAPAISQTDNEKIIIKEHKDSDNASQKEVHSVEVDKQAEFQGGDLEKFREWIQAQLVYPAEAVSQGIFGRVTVQFEVDEKGKVGKVNVLRSVEPLLDAEAIRVVSSSPDWTPAQKDKKDVAQMFVIPVVFSLEENKP